MKKLVYLIIMSLLLTLVPVDSAEAATKVSGPTVTSVYDKKLDDFKYKFTHPNKNAVIYYRGVDTKKWKRAKNGQTLKLGYFEQQDGIYVYAKVGKTKSKARLVVPRGLDERAAEAKAKKDLSKVINKDDNKDMKFMKLLVYFKKNYDYTLSYYVNNTCDMYETKTVFRRKGECGALANAFTLYCKVLGIKAETVTYRDVDYKYRYNHAWNHVYLDKYPVLIDPTSFCCGENCTYLYDYLELDYNTYLKSKYQFTKTKAAACEYIFQGKLRRGGLVFEELVWGETSDVRFEHNKVTFHFYDTSGVDSGCADEPEDLTVTLTYYPSTGYWYEKVVDNATGEITRDDKAEVDAWYTAHPEVERS